MRRASTILAAGLAVAASFGAAGEAIQASRLYSTPSTRRRFPRRTPAWTNASYARAMAKKKRRRAARGGRRG